MRDGTRRPARHANLDWADEVPGTEDFPAVRDWLAERRTERAPVLADPVALALAELDAEADWRAMFRV